MRHFTVMLALGHYVAVETAYMVSYPSTWSVTWKGAATDHQTAIDAAKDK